MAGSVCGKKREVKVLINKLNFDLSRKNEISTVQIEHRKISKTNKFVCLRNIVKYGKYSLAKFVKFV